MDQSTFMVGPGVQESIQTANDEPRSDEMYVTPEVSLTYGKEAIYYYFKQDNTVRRVPFDAPE